MDIYTTAAAATETPLPSDRVIDGINLIPRVTGKVSFDPERPLFWRAMYNRAMRKGQWKLLVNDRTNTIQLFNLTSDRGETRDVSAEHPEIVQQLMNDLGEWGRGLEAPRWPHVMNYRQKDRFGEFLFAM